MTAPRTNAEIARTSYSAFASRDRSTVESLLSDDFTFTSPYDDHIDRDTYFERCWPYGDQIERFQIVTVMESGEQVLIVYEITPKDGRPFRNAERVRLRDGKITEVEVFFGSLPG